MSQGIVSESFYSRVERGTRKINIVDLLAILNKNGIHLEDFFNENITNEKSDLGNISINYDQFKNVVVQLNQKDIPENKALEVRKLAQIAISYLKIFYEKGFIDEAQQIIKLIEQFPPYPLLAVDKLIAQYYRGLIDEDSLKIEQIRELVKIAGCGDVLKDLPKL